MFNPVRQSARMSKNCKWWLNTVWHRMLYSNSGRQRVKHRLKWHFNVNNFSVLLLQFLINLWLLNCHSNPPRVFIIQQCCCLGFVLFLVIMFSFVSIICCEMNLKLGQRAGWAMAWGGGQGKSVSMDKMLARLHSVDVCIKRHNVEWRMLYWGHFSKTNILLGRGATEG